MGFVRFTETGKSYKPHVSISRTGVIGLNDGARRRYGVEMFSHCVLYYDADNRRIGIELTRDGNLDGALKIRLRPTGADIAGRSFLSYFGIEVEETLVCPVSRDEGTGFLVVDMANGLKRGKKEVGASSDQYSLV